MKKYLPLTLIFFFILATIDNIYADTLKQDIKTIKKYGVVFINGKPAYIDVLNLPITEMTIAKSWINKCKINKEKIIQAGRLDWGDYNNLNVLYTYDTKINDSYARIWNSETKFNYKVKDNVMYLSKDSKEWEKLEISVVDQNPKQEDLGPYTVPIFMIIHLKCKWFEGEYEIIGSQKTGG